MCGGCLLGRPHRDVFGSQALFRVSYPVSGRCYDLDVCAGGLSRVMCSMSVAQPAFSTVRVGPLGSWESRILTARSVKSTSMHPLVPLYELLNQALATSFTATPCELRGSGMREPGVSGGPQYQQSTSVEEWMALKVVWKD